MSSPADSSGLCAALAFATSAALCGVLLGNLPPPLSMAITVVVVTALTRFGYVAGATAPASEPDSSPTPTVDSCEECGQGITISMHQLRCSRCAARYHADCWRPLGRCRSAQCDPHRPRPPREPGASARPQLQPRDAPARCPYCHDDLPESEAVGCAGCSTRYHAECLGEAGCVVLGCQQREPGRERAR